MPLSLNVSTIFELYRVLLVEKTGISGEASDLPQVIVKPYHQNCMYFKLRTF